MRAMVVGLEAAILAVLAEDTGAESVVVGLNYFHVGWFLCCDGTFVAGDCGWIVALWRSYPQILGFLGLSTDLLVIHRLPAEIV